MFEPIPDDYIEIIKDSKTISIVNNSLNQLRNKRDVKEFINHNNLDLISILKLLIEETQLLCQETNSANYISNIRDFSSKSLRKLKKIRYSIVENFLQRKHYEVYKKLLKILLNMRGNRIKLICMAHQIKVKESTI